MKYKLVSRDDSPDITAKINNGLKSSYSGLCSVLESSRSEIERRITVEKKDIDVSADDTVAILKEEESMVYISGQVKKVKDDGQFQEVIMKLSLKPKLN